MLMIAIHVVAARNGVSHTLWGFKGPVPVLDFFLTTTAAEILCKLLCRLQAQDVCKQSVVLKTDQT